MSKYETDKSKPMIRELNQDTLDHIRALAAVDNADLPQWCARQRRRDTFHRTAVTACFLAVFAFVTDTAYAHLPLYTEKAISGDFSAEQASDIIYEMLNNI